MDARARGSSLEIFTPTEPTASLPGASRLSRSARRLTAARGSLLAVFDAHDLGREALQRRQAGPLPMQRRVAQQANGVRPSFRIDLVDPRDHGLQARGVDEL